jgi:hypothetical protein
MNRSEKRFPHRFFAKAVAQPINCTLSAMISFLDTKD